MSYSFLSAVLQDMKARYNNQTSNTQIRSLF